MRIIRRAAFFRAGLGAVLAFALAAAPLPANSQFQRPQRVEIADLSVSPARPVVGQTMTVMMTLKNPGPAQAVGISWDIHRVSIPIGSGTLPSLAPGASVTVRASLTATEGSLSITGRAIVRASAGGNPLLAQKTVTVAVAAAPASAPPAAAASAPPAGSPAPAAALASISVTPVIVASGATATGTVMLTQPAPAGGVVVALAGGGSAAVLPGSVMVRQGELKAEFGITAQSVASAAVANISATYGGMTRTARVSIVAAEAPPKPAAVMTVNLGALRATGYRAEALPVMSMTLGTLSARGYRE